MNNWLENSIRFVIVFLLQVLLVNHMQFLGVCSPCIYILFLLLLPVSLPRWAELIIGALTGLVMDVFCNTLGIHMASCILLSYIRPLILKAMVQEKERLTGTPSSNMLGMSAYIRFVVILVFIHHMALFILLSFSWHNWWITLLQIIVSSLVSIGIFISYDLLKR